MLLLPHSQPETEEFLLSSPERAGDDGLMGKAPEKMYGLSDNLICATLRDENPPWPEGGNAEFAQAFLRRTNYQGVLALLNGCVRHSESWPAKIRNAIHSQVIVQAIWEQQHQKVLTRIFSAFAEIGIVRPSHIRFILNRS